MPPGDPGLSNQELAPYILGRATNDKSMVGGLYMRKFPPSEVVPQGEIVRVSGVGDTMLGVLMAGLMKQS